MIDNFRPQRRGDFLRPADRANAAKTVVGDHSRDRGYMPATQSTPPQPSFVPPQEVAAKEELQPGTTTGGHILPKPPKEKTSLFDKLRNLDKKQRLILIGILIVLIAGGITAYMLLTKDTPAPNAKVTKKTQTITPPKPTTVASHLTGLQVAPDINERPVTGIMIENSPDARPQSSLDHAGIVFEAIAEGGITRFLALYQDSEPDYIGPVRSVRPYYVQWAIGFDAPLAHVGGSEDGLALVRTAKDLDQFAGASYFWRINSRYAPHNMYTSIAKLREYESKKGYGKSNYTGLARKSEQASKTPNATSIDMAVSSALYSPHYDYDAASNSYKRSQGGAAHMVTDAFGTQVQLAPKVVVALVMPQGLNGKYTTYQTLGTGKTYIFQDGVVTEGTWKKGANNEQFTFTGAAGKTIALNPGPTWFTVVGDAAKVTYR
jgi:hypothetical protein